MDKEILTEGNTRGNVKPGVGSHSDGCNKPDTTTQRPVNPPNGPQKPSK